ncbi:restriction endonuclease, partial [Mycobacteroides abscessus]
MMLQRFRRRVARMRRRLSRAFVTLVVVVLTGPVIAL